MSKNNFFTSKAFTKFKNFHIQLNTFVKLSTVSVDHLAKSEDSSDELSGLIEKLILDAGEKWTNERFKNPKEELSILRLQMSQSAIMWVYSSFEVFLNQVNSTCSDYQIERKDEIEEKDLESIRLKRLFNSYNWDLSTLDHLLPLYNYYSTSRHCIVHNMGKANKEIIEISNSKEFKYAMENWPTVIPNRVLSPAPVINEDFNMVFKPHHAITYSDVCFRIAKYVNEKLLDTLGIKYYIIKAVKQNLLNIQSFKHPKCKHLYSYINYILKEEYNFDSIATSRIKEILEEKEILQKCNEKYNYLSNVAL